MSVYYCATALYYCTDTDYNRETTFYYRITAAKYSATTVYYGLPRTSAQPLATAERPLSSTASTRPSSAPPRRMSGLPCTSGLMLPFVKTAPPLHRHVLHLRQLASKKSRLRQVRRLHCLGPRQNYLATNPSSVQPLPCTTPSG